MKTIIVIFALLSLVFKKSYAIDCYQCLSTGLDNPYQCGEYLQDSDLLPKPCKDVYDAAYCIKQTGRFEGGLGTKRYCSSLDLGNYCNYIRQPGDELEYRSCVYTCDSDGCNNSYVVQPYFMSILFLGFTLYLL